MAFNEHPVHLTSPTPFEGRDSSISSLLNNNVHHRREKSRRAGDRKTADSQSQEDKEAETRNTVVSAAAWPGEPLMGPQSG